MTGTGDAWYAEYLGKRIGFVVATRKGFKPFIGSPVESPGDDDCFISVEASQPPQESLEEALAFLDAEAGILHRVFRRPDRPSDMGHWLVSLVIREDGADPRNHADVRYGS